jgi:nitrous oxidase accessory protein NosD
VTGNGGDRLVVRDCHVESIAITGGADHRIIANVIAGGSVALMGARRSEVRANYQHGLRWGVGIMVAGGAEHLVADNECRDDLCAIRVAGSERTRVERNRTETRWWGIHVLDSRETVVRSNRAWRVMRAVNVEGAGASGTVIDHQLAEHCDSGVVIERGAGDTTVRDSWFHDCRVGVLVWEAGTVAVTNTAISEPRDHAVVTDRALDLAGNHLDGDVWIGTP